MGWAFTNITIGDEFVFYDSAKNEFALVGKILNLLDYISNFEILT